MLSWKKILDQLESGELRAAYQNEHNEWIVNTQVKEAILQAFKAGKNCALRGLYKGFIDKDTLQPRCFTLKDKVRIVPTGSCVRHGAYVAPKVIIMPPSYINVGAYIDSNSMIDSHVLVGSCAQIGKNVHLSAGVQIGGVLEPIGAKPVIIEDEVFVGAGAIIVEGILVRKRAVIAPGVILSRGIPIYDCVNKCVITDHVIPENAVIVSGTRPINSAWAKQQNLFVACALLIKQRDNKSDAALTLEQILR